MSSVIVVNELIEGTTQIDFLNLAGWVSFMATLETIYNIIIIEIFSL